MSRKPLLIVTAAASEAAAIRRALPSHRRGRIGEHVAAPPPDAMSCPCWVSASGGRAVTIVQGGVGFRRAERATDLALHASRPGGVMVLGFAGSLRADLIPGALIVAERTRAAGPDGPDGVEIASDPTFVGTAVAAGEAAQIPTVCGTLVTAPALVATARAKAAMAAATGGLAVDMESAAVATVAVAAGLPFLAVKVIFDAADEPLHPMLIDVVRPDGSPRILHAALLAVRDRDVRDALHRAGRRARMAGRVLTRFCRAFFPRLEGGD